MLAKIVQEIHAPDDLAVEGVMGGGGRGGGGVVILYSRTKNKSACTYVLEYSSTIGSRNRIGIMINAVVLVDRPKTQYHLHRRHHLSTNIPQPPRDQARASPWQSTNCASI